MSTLENGMTCPKQAAGPYLRISAYNSTLYPGGEYKNWANVPLPESQAYNVVVCSGKLDGAQSKRDASLQA